MKNFITGDVWIVDLKQLVQCGRSGREQSVCRGLLPPDDEPRSS